MKTKVKPITPVMEDVNGVLVRKDATYPLSVSYHGDSICLIGSDGRWATSQIAQDRAEKLCRMVNTIKLG